MKKNILVFSLVYILFCGCFFNTAAATDKGNANISEASYSANHFQRRQKRRSRGGRLIIHRNSGNVRRAVCRDGSISLSKNRRGTCSRHGGVRRWL